MAKFIAWVLTVGLILIFGGKLTGAAIHVARVAAEKYQHPMSYTKFNRALWTRNGNSNKKGGFVDDEL
ncbi:MAG: hypothetical protein V4736_13870 [Bdellovibrionota bacterium]